MRTCPTWPELSQRLQKIFLVYETDLSVRTQIEELFIIPEFPCAARISEYVSDLEYLFSRMNKGSYGPTELHLWLLGKIPLRTWKNCSSTSERKRRTHTPHDLVDLLIELALDRRNNSHMEKFLKRQKGKGANPTPDCAESRGSKIPSNRNKAGGKMGG